MKFVWHEQAFKVLPAFPNCDTAGCPHLMSTLDFHTRCSQLMLCTLPLSVFWFQDQSLLYAAAVHVR